MQDSPYVFESFSYIFKYITGRTFTEYVLYLRVMQRARALSTTDRKQFDISRECGFANEYYFHRVFKNNRASARRVQKAVPIRHSPRISLTADISLPLEKKLCNHFRDGLV